jgi:hypothetical protein
MRFLFLTVFALLGAGAAEAANDTRETWQAAWGGGTCTLTLTYDLADLQGRVRVGRPCGGELVAAKSFVYTDDSRSQMILFARPGARGAMIGSFEATGQGRMQGLIADGVPAEIVLTERSSTGITIGGTASTGACIRYADGGCARSADLKNPDIRFGQPAQMRALGQLTIFPFSGGKGFAKDEVVAPGQCRMVKKCETAFGTTEDWCEVILEDGFFTGWVRRQDANFVYLRTGC